MKQPYVPPSLLKELTERVAALSPGLDIEERTKQLAPITMRTLEAFPPVLEEMCGTMAVFFSTHPVGPYDANIVGPEILRVIQKYPEVLEAVRVALNAEEQIGGD